MGTPELYGYPDFQSPIVFAYYYGDGFMNCSKGQTFDRCTRWYQTDERGQLSYEYSDARYQHSSARWRPWPVQAQDPCQRDAIHREQLSVLLNSPGNRKHPHQPEKVVKEHNFDGVNIDFER